MALRTLATTWHLPETESPGNNTQNIVADSKGPLIYGSSQNSFNLSWYPEFIALQVGNNSPLQDKDAPVTAEAEKVPWNLLRKDDAL